jgi:hypothetical protein
MKIYRITDGISVGTTVRTNNFVQAQNPEQALKGFSGDCMVQEWRHCRGERHGKIPGTDVCPSPEAISVIMGVPLCRVCLEQSTMSDAERLDRLEELIVELRGDFDRHTEEEE